MRVSTPAFIAAVSRRLARPAGWLLLGLLPLSAAVAPARPSQIQVARQFLLAILRADYGPAYALLTPEVRTAVPLARFRAAARPLYEQGQRRRPVIDLYKLGLRIGEQNDVRNFYSFTFRSDTLAAKPQVQLDVTFRDSTAAGILSFGLIPAPQRPAR